MAYELYPKKAIKKKKKNLLCIKADIMTEITFFLNKEHARRTGRGRVALNSLFLLRNFTH